MEYEGGKIELYTQTYTYDVYEPFLDFLSLLKSMNVYKAVLLMDSCKRSNNFSIHIYIGTDNR